MGRSKNYDYENNSELNKTASRNKLIIISLLIVALLVLTILVLRGCSSDNKSSSYDYEKNLIEAAKKYYDNNEHKLPTVVGECNTVDLDILANGVKYVSIKKYSDCDIEKTHVQVCKIDEKTYNFTPWLVCDSYNSEDLYNPAFEGTVSDVKENESYISFKYIPQVLDMENLDLGEVEEYEKDQIPYKNYKTLETVTYYSYKDEQWIWNTKTNYYYTSTGDKTSTNEYYTTTPNSKYSSKDSGTTVYKWYKEEGTKKEYYTLNGNIQYLDSAPSGYTYKDESNTEVRTFYSEVLDKQNALHYYVCKTGANSDISIHQAEVPCQNADGKNTRNPLYTYTVKDYYACAKDYISTSNGDITASTVCVKLAASSNTCPSGKTCVKGSKTYYAWYKLVDSNERKYYPSNASTSDKENVYYASSPAEGYQKDESTKTTGYKWYYTVEGTTKDYVSESPGKDATKTSKSRFTSWSEWSTNKPDTKSYRTIETKTKIKLQEIKNTSNSYVDLSTNYVTLEEMINIFKQNNYEVNSISDIANNGQITFKTLMYIRNKKEN